MASWSFTRSRAWKSCPLSFWLGTQGVQRVVPEAVKLGSRNHLLAENFVDQSLNTMDTIQAITDGLRAQSESMGADPQFLDAFSAMFADVPLPDFEAGDSWVVEERMQTDDEGIPVESEAFWSGVVDYAILGETLTVIDWKTGWGYGSKNDLEQVKIYAGALMESGWDCETADCRVMRPLRRWHDIETFTGDECRQSFLQHLAMGKEAVEKASEWTTAEEADANPGSHCSSCFYRHSCPHYADMAEKVTWNNPEDAWQQRSILKARLDSIDSYLKNQLELYGDLPAEGGRIRFKTSEVVKLDPKAIALALRENGLPPDTFFKSVSLSKSSLRRGLGSKQKELFDSLLEEHGTVSYRKQLDWTDKEEE